MSVLYLVTRIYPCDNSCLLQVPMVRKLAVSWTSARHVSISWLLRFPTTTCQSADVPVEQQSVQHGNQLTIVDQPTNRKWRQKHHVFLFIQWKVPWLPVSSMLTRMQWAQCTQWPLQWVMISPCSSGPSSPNLKNSENELWWVHSSYYVFLILLLKYNFRFCITKPLQILYIFITEPLHYYKFTKPLLA